MDEGEGATSSTSLKKKVKRASSQARERARSQSRARDASAYRDSAQELAAEKIKRKTQSKFQRNCRSGEADRRVMDMMPKHLNTGKRGIGKTDR